MSWIFLAEPGSLGALSPRPWLTTAYDPARPPIVSASPTLKAFFSADKCAASLTEPPSAPTSPSSPGPSCLPPQASTASTPSSAVSPAKISAWQALARAWTASAAAFSSRSSASLASFDPASSDWRTSQQLLFEGGGGLLERLPRWGMTSGGELWELTTLVAPTAASAGGAWPTATAESAESAGAHRGKLDTLSSAVKSWPLGSPWATPTARDSKSADLPGSGNWERKKAAGWTIDLNSQAAASSALPRATPTRRDWRSGAVSDKTLNRNSRPLNEQACSGQNPSASAWPTPRANSTTGASKHGDGGPDLQTVASQHAPPTQPIPPGQRSSEPTPKLNPLFVEWLLGSPFGTTELEPAVMAWILSARRKRSKSC